MWNKVRLVVAGAHALPLQIGVIWVHIGKNWYGMFGFLESSVTPDANSDCAAISAADVAAYTPQLRHL